MITPIEVVKHLKTYLPQVTDLFTNNETVIGASSAGSVLSVNIASHGFNVGKQLILSAGTTRNQLDSSNIITPGCVTFTTVFDHDLIEPSQFNDDLTLELGGFGSVWDGTHNISTVQNRKTFDVALPSGETVAPTLDGNQYLVDNVGLGLQTVATVVDVNNFTIDISDLPPMPTGTIDGLQIISGFRISAAADFNRAQAAYSQQNQDEAYLYVIMTDVDASKDRHTIDDAIAGFTQQDLKLLRLLQNFSTTVFLPTRDEITGADAQTLAYGQIYDALNRVLYGFGFTDQESAIAYVTVSAGHGPGVYNTAYLTHVYDWQLPAAITFENGFNMQEDVAFRDIEQTLFLNGDEEAPLIANTNLDEEPL